MKRTLLYLLLTVVVLPLQAQVYISKLKKKDLAMVKNITVYVLLRDADTLYNKTIKELVQAHYKYSSYDFIMQSELDKFEKYEQAIILTPAKYTYHSENNNIEKQRTRTVSINDLLFGLFLYNHSKSAFSNDIPLCGINELLIASEFPNFTDDKTAAGTIGCFSRTYTKALTQMSFMTFMRVLDKYSTGMESQLEIKKDISANVTALTGKTLIIAEQDLCIVKDSIKKYYPHKYKIVNMDEYAGLIGSEDTTLAFYWPNYTGFSSTELIVTPGNWNICYAAGGPEVTVERNSPGFKLYKEVTYVNWRKSNEKWADTKYTGTGFSPVTCDYINRSVKKMKRKSNQ